MITAGTIKAPSWKCPCDDCPNNAFNFSIDSTDYYCPTVCEEYKKYMDEMARLNGWDVKP